MRLWRLIKLFAGGGMLVVLGAAALMLWPLLWPPDPDASVQLVNGRMIGEATGYVGRIDRDARTVDVSASLVGWRPVVLIVNETTSILVQNRQGGFGDLWKDMPVRVSYEVVGDARLARSIEVVTGDAEPSRSAVNGAVRVPVMPPTAAPRAVVSPVPAVAPPPAAALPATVTPPAASRAADPAPVRPATSAAPAPTAVVPPPAKPAPAPVATPRAVEAPRRVEAPPVEAPQRVEGPATRAPRPEPEAPSAARSSRPAEADPSDGAAAIDWLLKERGSR